MTSAAPSLSAEALMRDAVDKTGLDDFGDSRFRRPLSLLLESCLASGTLTHRGGAVLRSVALRHLRNRLYLQAYLARGAPERVAEAVVVTGLPRTGTSLLHNLLALDPRHRFLRLWEGLHPVPPGGGPGTPDEESLVRGAEAWLKRFYEHAPRFRVVRDLSPEGPEECDALLQNAFASQHFADMFDAPEYARWFFRGNLRAEYDYYTLQLAALGRRGRDRWVLKSPGHLGHLDALLGALPRARIVHCHRDPARAVVSYASLILAVRSPNCGPVPGAAVGAQALERCRIALQRALEVRSRAKPELFFDVSFAQLTSEPLVVVRGIYQWLGRPLAADAEARMRAWLESHPPHRRGVHAYDPADFGLSEEGIRDELDAYLEDFATVASR